MTQPPAYAIEADGTTHLLVVDHRVECGRDLADVRLTGDISDVDPGELCPRCFPATAELMAVLS